MAQEKPERTRGNPSTKPGEVEPAISANDMNNEDSGAFKKYQRTAPRDLSTQQTIIAATCRIGLFLSIFSMLWIWLSPKNNPRWLRIIRNQHALFLITPTSVAVRLFANALTAQATWCFHPRDAGNSSRTCCLDVDRALRQQRDGHPVTRSGVHRT